MLHFFEKNKICGIELMLKTFLGGWVGFGWVWGNKTKNVESNFCQKRFFCGVFFFFFFFFVHYIITDM